MKKYPPRHTVGISLSKEMHEKIKKAAERKNRSVSSVIRELITRYLSYIK